MKIGMAIPGSITAGSLLRDSDFTASFGEGIAGGLVNGGVSGIGTDGVNITAIEMRDGRGAWRMVRSSFGFIFFGTEGNKRY